MRCCDRCASSVQMSPRSALAWTRPALRQDVLQVAPAGLRLQSGKGASSPSSLLGVAATAARACACASLVRNVPRSASLGLSAMCYGPSPALPALWIEVHAFRERKDRCCGELLTQPTVRLLARPCLHVASPDRRLQNTLARAYSENSLGCPSGHRMGVRMFVARCAGVICETIRTAVERGVDCKDKYVGGGCISRGPC